MSEQEFLNTFDFMDFIDEDEWPLDGEYDQHRPELLSDLHSSIAVNPMDKDLYEMQELHLFEPIVNF